MENNMAMEYPMFATNVSKTAGGKGCTKLGVCGKTPEVAALQDLTHIPNKRNQLLCKRNY